jgi:hypothetical protein
MGGGCACTHQSRLGGQDVSKQHVGSRQCAIWHIHSMLHCQTTWVMHCVVTSYGGRQMVVVNQPSPSQEVHTSGKSYALGETASDLMAIPRTSDRMHSLEHCVEALMPHYPRNSPQVDDHRSVVA